MEIKTLSKFCLESSQTLEQGFSKRGKFPRGDLSNFGGENLKILMMNLYQIFWTGVADEEQKKGTEVYVSNFENYTRNFEVADEK